MALPLEPEPIEVLRARFGDALRRSYGPQEIERDPEADGPGLHREHVFDFTDGLRLIVSYDHLDQSQPEPILHVSASARTGSPARREVGTIEALLEYVQKAMSSLAQMAVPLAFLGIEGHIPRWVGPLRSIFEEMRKDQRCRG